MLLPPKFPLASVPFAGVPFDVVPFDVVPFDVFCFAVEGVEWTFSLFLAFLALFVFFEGDGAMKEEGE